MFSCEFCEISKNMFFTEHLWWLLLKRKWLIVSLYNPYKTTISSHLKDILKEIGSLPSKCENIIPLGDFNCELKEETLSIFCEVHNLKNLLKEPNCFKNPEKAIIIDLILTNKPKCFHHSCTYETGISDFHKMTITLMRVIFKKQKPKTIFYRNYKNFDKKSFKEYLKVSLEAYDFQNVCLTSLISFAPLKKKYVRANQVSFMNKELKNAVMVSSKLRNKFVKSRSVEDRKAYNKQRNMCIKLLKKTNSFCYFSNLNTKRIVDNKMFRKTVKSSFSDKLNNFESITLVKNDSIVSDDNEVTISSMNILVIS